MRADFTLKTPLLLPFSMLGNFNYIVDCQVLFTAFHPIEHLAEELAGECLLCIGMVINFEALPVFVLQ